MNIQNILKELEDDERNELIESLRDANFYLSKILDCFSEQFEEAIQLEKASEIICKILEDCE